MYEPYHIIIIYYDCSNILPAMQHCGKVLPAMHILTLQNEASVVAVAAEEDFSSVYIAYSNGGLKVWSAHQVNDIHDSVPGIVYHTFNTSPQNDLL